MTWSTPKTDACQTWWFWYIDFLSCWFFHLHLASEAVSCLFTSFILGSWERCLVQQFPRTRFEDIFLQTRLWRVWIWSGCYSHRYNWNSKVRSIIWSNDSVASSVSAGFLYTICTNIDSSILMLVPSIKSCNLWCQAKVLLCLCLWQVKCWLLCYLQVFPVSQQLWDLGLLIHRVTVVNAVNKTCWECSLYFCFPLNSVPR